MTRSAFRDLSPGPGGAIDADDPTIRLWLRSLRQAGLDGDQANILINGTLFRLNAAAKENGKPLEFMDAAMIFLEQAMGEGLTEEKAMAVAERVTNALQDPPMDNASLLDPEHVAQLEHWMLEELNAGRMSPADFSVLVDNSDSVETVEFVTRLMDYNTGNGPDPGSHPDLPTVDTSRYAPPASNGTIDTNTQEDTAMTAEHDNDTNKQDTPEQRAAKIAAYARYQNPLQNAHGAEGDLYRAETEKAFSEAFGDESGGDTGRSEAGYGV